MRPPRRSFTLRHLCPCVYACVMHSALMFVISLCFIDAASCVLNHSTSVRRIRFHSFLKTTFFLFFGWDASRRGTFLFNSALFDVHLPVSSIPPPSAHVHMKISPIRSAPVPLFLQPEGCSTSRAIKPYPYILQPLIPFASVKTPSTAVYGARRNAQRRSSH